MVNNLLAQRLKEERKRLKMTQQEIAEKVFVARETWSRYEAAKIIPSAEILVNLNKLDIDTHYILTGHKVFQLENKKGVTKASLTVAETKGTYKVELQLTKRELDLIKYYRKVNGTGKDSIDNIAKLLAEQQTK